MSCGGRRPAAAWLALCGAAAAVGAADWTVAATATPASVAVGERIELCVAVKATRPTDRPAAALDVTTPEPERGLVVDAARFESHRFVDGRYEYGCCWTLQADAVGTFRIPPLTVTARLPDGTAETLATNALAVAVTPPGEGAAADPADHPPAGLTPFQWWVLAGAGATVLVSLAAGLSWLRRDPATAAVGPERTTAGRAVAELRRAEAALEAGDLERCYALLAGALYTYVARRRELPGDGLTTTEANARLAEAGVAADFRRTVAEALAVADRVRFAGHESSPAEARGWLRRVELALLDAARKEPRLESGASRGT